ncbi:MAG: DUF928 domain-containing protein [Spirulina sp.]
MRKTILKNAVLYLGIAFYALSTFAVMSVAAEVKNEDRGEFPEGRVGGGTRTISTCASKAPQLVGLSPNDNLGVTAREQPLIYIAVPKLDRLHPAEFILSDREGNTIYETSLEVGQAQEFIGIRLPENVLHIGENYHWFFDIFCDFDTNAEQAIGINGTVRKIAREEPTNPPSSLEERLALVQSYQKAGLWSDAIATAIELRRTYPNSDRVFAQWKQVLSALEFNEYEGLLEMLLEIQIPTLSVSESN